MITSAQNPLIKRCRRLLRSKKARLAEGVGFIEGIRPVLTILERSPGHIEKILLAPELLQSQIASKMIGEAAVQVEEISAPLFTSLSDRQNPIGLAAIVKSPLRFLSDVPVVPHGQYLLLESISDPGNLGTIIRSADAAGVTGVVFLNAAADVTHPFALKASMGTAFVVPIAAIDDIATFIHWSSTHHVQLIATSAKADRLIWDVGLALDRPVVWMMGSEQRGLSENAGNAADSAVRIPMMGEASSLNVATATAILLYEFRRRRHDATQS